MVTWSAGKCTSHCAITAHSVDSQKVMPTYAITALQELLILDQGPQTPAIRLDTA